MATLIERKYIENGKYWCDFAGKSTEEKPTDASIYDNSYFTEVDTGDMYYFDCGEWKKFGGVANGN